MAYFVTTPPLRRIHRLLNPEVSSGSKGELVYSLPIYLRKDGTVVKLGYLVTKTGSEIVYTVRELLVREDLTSVTVVLSPVECGDGDMAKMREELVLAEVGEVQPLKGRLMALDLAKDGMRKVARNIASYPLHIQRVVRKHQLSTQIRTSVQGFLAGFSLARSTSLGCVDWRLDPGLLGFERETDFSVEYRVERFAGGVTSHLDLLLGTGWDVREIGGGAGFRVIMTLELAVDINQQLRLDTHATTCSGEVDCNYRAKCMEAFARNRTPARPNLNILKLNKNMEQTPTKLNDTPERFESIQSNRDPGISLDWEEFQDSQDESTLGVSILTAEIHAAEVLTGHDDSFNDTADCDAIDGASDPTDADESLMTIKKLLDTPTKGFNQLVFNVSNKQSGDSSDSKTNTMTEKSSQLVTDAVEKIREIHFSEESFPSDSNTTTDRMSEVFNDVVGKIREVQLSEDSFDNDFDLKDESQNLSPVKLESKFSDSNFSTIGVLTKIEPAQPDGCVISTRITSTPDVKLGRKLERPHSDNQNEFNVQIDEIEMAKSQYLGKNDHAGNNYDTDAEVAVATERDCIFGDQNDKMIESTSTNRTSHSYDLTDGNLLTSPEEDICSEDYTMSSSNDIKQDKVKEALENDDEEETIKSISKITPVGSDLLNSNNEVSYSPESCSKASGLLSSPQSSVNKVAAYVQSLPSPQNSAGGDYIDSTEEIEDFNKNMVDEENINDEDANNSIASSRSKASRQSDLSSLTGRFSNGMFYGSAISASGAASGQTVCPFPDDWQFNTIPESIENDEDID